VQLKNQTSAVIKMLIFRLDAARSVCGSEGKQVEYSFKKFLLTEFLFFL